MVTVYNEKFNTKAKQLSPKVAGIIFIIVGLIFVGVAAFVMKSENDAKARMTESVEGQLLDNGWYVDDDGDRMYRPSYSYAVSGTDYKCVSSVSTSVEPFGPSKIYYDPANPKDCRTAESKNGSSLLYIIFFGIGGVAVVAGIVALFVKPKNKTE